ncbi:MAG: hypothetical protein ACI9U2_002057 [Bradymonadia bacterium]|jgi:hypothetical protein
MRASWRVALALCLAGCPDPASDALLRPDARPLSEMGAPDPPDATPLDAFFDATQRDAFLNATPDGAVPGGAVPEDATPDVAADADIDAALPDPCALGEVDAHVRIGPAGGDPFRPWASPTALPLAQLAQGGAVTRFDLLVLGADAQADGITVSIIDRVTAQELAFGQSGPTRLPCRAGVGRALVNRAVDYSVDFASADLLGREVRLIVTITTPDGALFGAVDGVLEAAQ